MKIPLTAALVSETLHKLRTIGKVATHLGWSKSSIERFMNENGISPFYRRGHRDRNKYSEKPEITIMRRYIDDITGFPVTVLSAGYANGYIPQKSARQKI